MKLVRRVGWTSRIDQRWQSVQEVREAVRSNALGTIPFVYRDVDVANSSQRATFCWDTECILNIVSLGATIITMVRLEWCLRASLQTQQGNDSGLGQSSCSSKFHLLTCYVVLLRAVSTLRMATCSRVKSGTEVLV